MNIAELNVLNEFESEENEIEGNKTNRYDFNNLYGAHEVSENKKVLYLL